MKSNTKSVHSNHSNSYQVPNQSRTNNDDDSDTEEVPEETVVIDERTQEAIDWFNSLKKRTKYDLILNQYELQMSLKDIKTERLKEAIDKKWHTDINSLKNIIKEKEVSIRELKIENEALVSTSQKNTSQLISKMNENQSVYIKEISQLEQKMLKNNAQLEQLITNASNSVHNSVHDSMNNTANSAIVSLQNDCPEDIEFFLNTVPNCSIINEQFENIIIETNGIKGLVNRKPIEKVTIDRINAFKQVIQQTQESIEFAVFISKSSIHGRTFNLEFESTKRGNVFLFYVTDPFRYSDRLVTVFNLVTTLSTNIKYTENINNILYNINTLFDKIQKLREINEKLNVVVNSQIDIIRENELCIESLHNGIRFTIKSNETNVDKKHRICIDIVKYYIMNNRPFTLKDVISKAELFGIKSSQANTIITRQLGGLKELRVIARNSIDKNEPCTVNFDFDDKIEDSLINDSLKKINDGTDTESE